MSYIAYARKLTSDAILYFFTKSKIQNAGENEETHLLKEVSFAVHDRNDNCCIGVSPIYFKHMQA